MYRENSPNTNEDIFAVSPDGRWLAYVSDETGRREVYLRPFVDGPGKRQVSAAGGDEPAPVFDDDFSRSGRYANYDVLPGDSSFVMLEPVRGSVELRFVANWEPLVSH